MDRNPGRNVAPADSKSPDAYVALAGFTDNVGSEEYNPGHSATRAMNVGEYVMNNHDIAPERMAPSGSARPTPRPTMTPRRGERRTGGWKSPSVWHGCEICIDRRHLSKKNDDKVVNYL